MPASSKTSPAGEKSDNNKLNLPGLVSTILNGEMSSATRRAYRLCSIFMRLRGVGVLLIRCGCPLRSTSCAVTSRRAYTRASNERTPQSEGEGQEDRPTHTDHEAARRHDGQGKRGEGRGRRQACVRLYRQLAAAAARDRRAHRCPSGR